MDEQPKRSNKLRFNFDLVLAEITRWPIVTVAVLAIMSAEFVLLPQPPELRELLSSTGAAEKALFLAGTLVAMLGIKAILLLSFYPLFRNRPYPGSYLVTSFIACVPLMAFFAAGAMLSKEGPVPAYVMLATAYVICSPFIAIFIRLMHANPSMQPAAADKWRTRMRSIFRRS